MIALLPMKGNSERVPKKNIRLMHGKPLFFYIADTLLESNHFDLLAINTDSEEISEIAKNKYGNWVKIIERPASLVGDFVSMNLIINHDVEFLGKENDFFQTHSTNPLLTQETIIKAVNVYQQGVREQNIDSLFSVNLIQTRLYDRNLRPINHDPKILTRTQDLDIIYEENSNFYIFSGKSFLENAHRIGKKSIAYVMSKNSVESIDIDENADWELAELVLKGKQKNG
ncbi:acylneuraminate cytidylyltransferase family protein [Leptospira levettii]|uniref:acylneuraminate cytidylyltransferase family protein n=1 Tax=Leptospira levettii TaxID=2023178 RepID=UPI00223D9111|nr:acylneuraminate cytidylyltransferase family protein [Leptospira levettii]MCW7497033.1 acylneuraminate cytidylyltransferase family protein [Leptospira levettii]